MSPRAPTGAVVRVNVRLALPAALLLAVAALAMPSASASADVPDTPVRYQCSAGMESSFCTLTAGPCHETTGSTQSDETSYTWRTAGCTTPATGPCGAFTDSRGAVRASCSTAATGDCEAQVAVPPLLWCENYGPGGSSSVSVGPPALPCQSGIAGTDCAVGALDCAAHTGYRTGSASYDYAGLYCGPELWAPCELAYADTTGQVRSCLLATASASASASQPPCQSGFAQSWCDVSAGPCHVHAVTWTAWGDRSASADCTAAGTACHAEAHTDGLANGHDCGPAAAALFMPCTVSLPPHFGFDCWVGDVHCLFYIWLDLGPPNTTWDCLL